METKLKRKGRYQRRSKLVPIVMTDNVLDILAIAARYPVLRTHRFYDLLPHRSKTRVRLMLDILHDYQYVGRYRDDHPTPFLACEYYIMPKGLALLAEHGREVRRSVSDQRPQPGEQRRLHTHSMMITDVIGSIEAGAGSRFVPRETIIENVTHPDPLHFKCDFTYTFPSGKKERYDKSIKADEVFGITYPDMTRYFAVETENTSPRSRTTLQSSSFLRKVLAYGHVIGATFIYKQQLGITNMRVLVTAPSKERLQHKMDVVKEVAGKSTIFLFAVVPIGGHVGNLFTTPWLRVGYPPISLDTNS